MAKCLYPYMVERKLYHNQADRLVPVPCGKCPACLKRRLASWSHRLEVESIKWDVQHFVTLTYNTDFIPISKNGFLTLFPDHLTKFFKRLRKRSGKLVYYLCGEYGTANKRPHYHLILFGTSTLKASDIIASWSDPVTKKYYGDVYFGNVESASIRYTVQYYDKGDWRPAHDRDDRVPEFSRMSNGIGKDFLTPSMVRHLLENPDKGYIYNRDGHKISIPNYYKKRLYDYVSSPAVIAQHPSILIHRDDMLEKKDVHHKAIAELMQDTIDQFDDPDPEVRRQANESRKMEIINYRASKRKTRK